jgi:predicted transcriptional regulator
MKKNSGRKTREELERITVQEILQGERVNIIVPPKEERRSVLSIRMSPDLLRELDIMAHEEGQSLSSFTRNLIAEGLARRGAELSPEDLAELLINRARAEGKASRHVARASGGKPRPAKAAG